MTPNTTDFQYKKKSLWYIFLSICQMSLLCKISYFGKRYHLLSICKKCTIMWSTTVWYSHKYFFEVSEKLHYFGTVFDLCKIDKSINKSFFVHFLTIGSWLHNSNLIGKKCFRLWLLCKNCFKKYFACCEHVDKGFEKL